MSLLFATLFLRKNRPSKTLAQEIQAPEIQAPEIQAPEIQAPEILALDTTGLPEC